MIIPFGGPGLVGCQGILNLACALVAQCKELKITPGCVVVANGGHGIQAGLTADLKAGAVDADKPVVFVHTGGLGGVFAYQNLAAA